jgi:hypothetical protein
MTIPINPVAATTQEETSLGPGMALNGVAIYNDEKVEMYLLMQEH